MAPTSYRSLETESLSPKDAAEEKSKGLTADTARSTARQQPQVVLGPDGKPCRACNSKLAFAAAMKGTKMPSSSSAAKEAPEKDYSSSSSSPAAAVGAATSAAASLALTSAGSNERACPPDGEELGRSAWTLLHSAAAYFPEDPSAQQQSSMLAMFRALPHIYPCHSCAEALGEEYKREEKEGGWEDRNIKLAEAVHSGPALRKWLCGIHNEVNQRLGKPTFPCTEAKLTERWLDGPSDGSCD